MDSLQPHFLHILKNALTGQQLSSFPSLASDQWEALAKLAGQHKVLPMFYEAIRLLPELEGTPFLAELHRQSRQQIIIQTRKSCDFLRLYQALREAGVTPLVVKGIICRSLYPQPDYRPSSDEDLLVKPGQFSRCHEVFLREGLHTDATPAQLENDHEIPYRSATSPLFIELHKQLFPPESQAYGDLNRFFEENCDQAVLQTVDGTSISTLAPTDHLFYLIVHALKHFLHSGFGIRQVCDIILYANTWGNQVDWQRLLANCRQIRAEYFAAAIFRIGEKHLVFDPEKACYGTQWLQLQVSEDNLLHDVLLGGAYGSASKSRLHSSSITLNAMTANKQHRGSETHLLGVVFPPVRSLTGRYCWLKKSPWLLPLAWLDRIFHYCLEIRENDDSNAEEALKIGTQRIQLLKEYGIIR